MRIQGLNNSEICVWQGKGLVLLEIVNEDRGGDISEICYIEFNKELAHKLYNELGRILNN